MATLSSLLPAPRHSASGAGSLTSQLPPPTATRGAAALDLVDYAGPSAASTSSSAASASAPAPSAAAASKAGPRRIPLYGKREGWKPREQADFGNGGAYPECHIAQYPLEMGRKKTGGSGAALALQVDAEGTVRYDAIVQQGLKEGQHVQSSHRDLVPLKQRPDYKETAGELDRPNEDIVRETAERTRLALEKITQSKIKAAQPKNVATIGGNSSLVRYTPGGQDSSSNGQQRIIKMTDIVEDPLAPPRWKFKKVPKGPPSPPPPVLRSPPRKITAEEQREWMIPPCISNWKNNKGYTIPLDKRLAADGRGLQDVHINDNFAQFSEALHLADRHAREEVRQRALMQQKLAAKEKAAKEENLRMLAQRAREERSGVSSAVPLGGSADGAGSSSGPILAPNLAGRPTAASVTAAAGGGTGMQAALAGYGSDSGSDDGSEDSEDEAAAKARDELRAERRREHERELRMSNMGTEQRARVLMREQNRDISEKIALGLAKPTLSKDSQLDSRLFNREALAGSFGDDDSYNLYDKSLFQGSTAAAAIYRRPGQGGADDIYGGGTEEGIGEELQNDRFGLGKSKAFSGSELQEPRHGPVQFEKDTSDPFAIDKFLDEAKRGTKRAADENADARKRQRD